MGSEEDPRDYETSRKHFRIGFIIASVSGILMWLLMFFWIFHFNGGLSWGTNTATEINLHIVLMIFFAVYLQGHGKSKNKTYFVEEAFRVSSNICTNICRGTSIPVVSEQTQNASQIDARWDSLGHCHCNGYRSLVRRKRSVLVNFSTLLTGN